MNLGSYRPGESVHLLFTTVDATGAPAALVEVSAGPAVDVRVNSTATPVDSENVAANFGSVVGLNQVAIDTTGYALGDYTITISDGAVDGVSVVGYVVGRFRVESQGVLASGTAQAGAADSITLASGESSTNDFYTGGVVEIAAGTGAGQTPRVITDYVGATKVATIEPNWVVTPDSTSVYRVYSVPPSAGISEAMGVGLTLYGASTSDDVAAAGQDIQNLIGTPANGDLAADVAANLAAINAIDFDVEAVADAVWDELLAGHTDVGSAGAALAAAGSAGDPWTTPLPGSYGAGTAGQIVGDNLDAAVTTRATPAQVEARTTDALIAFDAATGTDVAVILGDTAAILAQTDNLPSAVQRNTALPAFEFLMVLASDHVTGATGLTVAAQRSIDGAAFGAAANAVVEVASGVYRIDLAASDLDGAVITFLFTAATADARVVTILTKP